MDKMNFDETIDKLTRLTARGQATFLQRYITQLSPSLCRSVIKYCYKRLDVINGTTKMVRIQLHGTMQDDTKATTVEFKTAGFRTVPFPLGTTVSYFKPVLQPDEKL